MVTVLVAVVLLYLLLGMFLDSIGIGDLPFTVPLIGAMARLVWFGVVVIKLLESA